MRRTMIRGIRSNVTRGAMLGCLLWLGSQTVQASCQLVPGSERCEDSTPCKMQANGLVACLADAPLPSGAVALHQSCWQYTYDYACSDVTTSNSCTPYEQDKNCTVAASSCVDKMPETGRCMSWQYTYECLTAPAKHEQRIICTNGLFNPDDYTAPANQNQNFSKAAILQEMMREAQVYTKDGVFKGVGESCKKGYLGIKNCCSPAPGGKSNSTLMNIAFDAAASEVKYVGGKAVDMASEYMFDMMYNNDFVTQGMMRDLLANDRFGTSFAGDPLSVSAYGFTFGMGTAPTTGVIAGGNGGYIAFNPYMLAASIAIMYLQSLAACSQDEQLLALHRGSNLSVFVSEECTKKVLGSCIEWTDKYCSFNSVLSKIINTQGKKQLGQDLSNCAGISTEDLARINFTQVDFSEFTSTIVNQASKNIPTDISGNYQPVMDKTSSGSQQGTNPVLPSY